MNIYQEIGQDFYYMEKGEYGTYFYYLSNLSYEDNLANAKSALRQLNTSIKARHKTMRSTPKKHPERFEFICEVDTTDEAVSVLTLLE